MKQKMGMLCGKNALRLHVNAILRFLFDFWLMCNYANFVCGLFAIYNKILLLLYFTWEASTANFVYT